MANINDLYSASKTLAEDVTAYMTSEVWVITARKRRDVEIASLKNLLGIATQNMRDAQTDEGRENARERARDYIAQINDVNERFKTEYESRQKYVMGDRDKALYKAFINAANNEDKVAALNAWFKHYGVEINAKFAAPYIAAMGGLRGATAAQIVRSDMKAWTAARTRNDLLKVFYRLLTEKMISVGTIKPAQLPADVQAAYAPKKRVTPSK